MNPRHTDAARDFAATARIFALARGSVSEARRLAYELSSPRVVATFDKAEPGSLGGTSPQWGEELSEYQQTAEGFIASLRNDGAFEDVLGSRYQRQERSGLQERRCARQAAAFDGRMGALLRSTTSSVCYYSEYRKRQALIALDGTKRELYHLSGSVEPKAATLSDEQGRSPSVRGALMQILKRPAVEAKAGISRTQIYEKMARGEFPSPVKLGPTAKAVGWVESEIDSWIAQRSAARDAKTKSDTA